MRTVASIRRTINHADSADVPPDTVHGQRARNGGRAKILDVTPDSPTVSLGMDFETFMCFCAGRWFVSDEAVMSKVGIEGDRSLGEKVLSEMCFIP